jgi:membrane protease YdiL (CAAX protease family)
MKTFETNVAPWPIDGISPSNGEVIAPTNEVTLSLDAIYDDDDNQITVRFYDNRGDLIGSRTVDNGESASVTWVIDNLGEHEWYAKASDGHENNRFPAEGSDDNTFNFTVDYPTEILDIETASPVNPSWPFDTIIYVRDNDGVDQISPSRLVIKKKGKYWNNPFNKESLYPFSWEKGKGFNEIGYFSDHIFLEFSEVVEKYKPGVTISGTGTKTFGLHNGVLENAESKVSYGFTDNVNLTLKINDNTILNIENVSGVGSIENRVDNFIEESNTVEISVDNEDRIEALSTNVTVNTKGIMGTWKFTTQMENDAKISENFDVWTRFYGGFDYEERVFDNVIKMPKTGSTLTVDAVASGYEENVEFNMTYPESPYAQKFGVSPVRYENLKWGYLASENYTITAEDLFGYEFDNWTGDVPVDENENSRTITLSLSDKSITANYTKINTLTVRAEVPHYDNEVEFTLYREGDANYPKSARVKPGNTYGWELENGSYSLEVEEIEGYNFDRWGGDFSGSSRTIDISLSDKTAIAYFVEEGEGPTPGQPGPAPAEELDMTIRVGKLVGGRGQAISGVFKETKNFIQGDTMVVRAEVTYGGEPIEAREIYMEYGDRRILMTKQEGGYYQGTLTISNNEVIGAHAVEVFASTAEGDISRSESLFVRALPAAPSPEEFPWWFKYLAVGLIIPTILVIPKAEWFKTPRNWSEKAKPGEWTFTKGTIILLALSAVGALVIGLISGVVNIGFALYSGLAIFIGAAVATEVRDDDEPLAVIGITAEYGERLVLSGIMFSISFVYLISVGLDAVGLAIYPMAFHMAMLSIAGVLTSVALTGVSIPIIEEVSVKGVITPLIAERFGIHRSTIGTGIIFGLLHVLFGGGISIFITAFIFGTVTAYMTLRNQSLLFAGAAHITYNMVVVLVSLGLL